MRADYGYNVRVGLHSYVNHGSVCFIYDSCDSFDFFGISRIAGTKRI